MTEKEIEQARDDLAQLDIEQLRCGVMLQLLKIEALKKERDALNDQVNALKVDHDKLIDRFETTSNLALRVDTKNVKLTAAAKLALDALAMAQNNLASRRAMLGGYTLVWDTYGTAIEALRQAGVQ